jgi:HK97 family phage prohead protease
MKIERRTFGMEFRADEESGKVTGYGAVFDSLSENLGGFRETIAPGAFDGVLEDDVVALINHDPNLLLARTSSGTLKLDVDSAGLRYAFDISEASYAKDLAISLKRGDIKQSSFAFSVDQDTWKEDDDGRIIRTIVKVARLYDVSPVTYPAYPDTSVALRGFEQFQQTLSRSTQIEHEQRARELEMLFV